MRIKKYGITLRRVEKRDLELIRKWRNSEKIKNKMIYQEYITKNMQIKWFNSIEKNINNAYYIILQKNKKTGLINVKNIFNNKISEAGLFMFNKEYYNSFIPVIASMIMIETSFYILKDFENNTIIKVLKTNKNAVNYNKSLGYFIINENDDVNYHEMKISLESFEKSTIKIRKALNNLHNNSNLEVIIDPIDFKLGLHKLYSNYIKVLDKINTKKIEKENYKEYLIKID